MNEKKIEESIASVQSHTVFDLLCTLSEWVLSSQKVFIKTEIMFSHDFLSIHIVLHIWIAVHYSSFISFSFLFLFNKICFHFFIFFKVTYMYSVYQLSALEKKQLRRQGHHVTQDRRKHFSCSYSTL